MSHYRLIDWATQAYLALVAFLIAAFHGNTVPFWPALVAAHLACLLLIHGLILFHTQGRGGHAIAFLRAFYPILLYTGFYRETGVLNQMFTSGYVDIAFLRLDQFLFGCQPSLLWMEQFPQRWIAEILYACYFSYYLMIGGIGLALLIRNRAQFDHFVSVISFVFYLCYLTYIFLPVMGPRIFFGDQAAAFFGAGTGSALPPDLLPDHSPVFPESVQLGWFYGLVIWIYHHFEAPGAAFPSSHVAISIATLYFSWRYLPAVRWPHALAVTGLCLSTIYCRYHYVVDVFAGIAVACTFVPIGNWIYRRFPPAPTRRNV